MVADWRRFCNVTDLAVDSHAVVVSLPGGRSHRIHVKEEVDAYRLDATVVGEAVASTLEDLPLETWERNRGTELVGFRIDAKGRLVGTAWVPFAGLTPQEFRTYLRTVAAECDRFEFQLTGRDAQ